MKRMIKFAIVAVILMAMFSSCATSYTCSGGSCRPKSGIGNYTGGYNIAYRQANHRR